MYEGLYRQQNNRHGLQQLAKPIAQPLARLGIGQDEALYHMTMKVEYVNKIPTVITPDVQTAPLALATYSEQYKQHTDDEYNKDFYIGETLGGI
ncbi:hypothetical protein [Priestia flexa]|uniref:hypothetical protein n=1 Tax=Priestia flexa TaxID=86664 RepID=UPI000473730A|nr:hypothetical protein [Priestia flexa]